MSVERIIRIKDEEEIIRVARRSAAYLIPRLLVACVFLLTPAFFLTPFLRAGTSGMVALGALFCVGLLVAIRTFAQWYYTMFIVTSHRVIHVHQAGVFDRAVTEAAHDVIQDVSYRKRGVLAMLSNVGTLSVQTGGSQQGIVVLDIPGPEELLAIVNDARRESARRRPPVMHQELARMIEGMDEATVSKLVQSVRAEKRGRAMRDFFADDDHGRTRGGHRDLDGDGIPDDEE